MKNYAGLQFIASYSTIFDSLESFLSHLRPVIALYEGHCFSVSSITLPVQQLSCIWLAVIFVLFHKSVINPLHYVCDPFLERKYLLLNSAL